MYYIIHSGSNTRDLPPNVFNRQTVNINVKLNYNVFIDFLSMEQDIMPKLLRQK